MVRRQPPSLAAEIPLTTLFPEAAQWGWYPWVCVKLNEVFLLGGKWLALLLGPAGIGKLPPTPSLIQIRE